MKYRIKAYDELRDKEIWNDLVACAQNGTFLFYRDFMDYHKDRFQDCSFLFYKQNKLVGVLPACKIDKICYSHAGLTYGGLVQISKIGAKDVLCFFDLLLNELRVAGFERIIYKPVPFIYCKSPEQADIYALFKNKFQKSECGLSSACVLNSPLIYTYEKKRSVSMAESCKLQVRESEDWNAYWEILENNLQNRYNKKPVHSLSEIKLLTSRFPKEICLFATFDMHDVMLAGVVLFISKNVVHIQYVASTQQGRKYGAVDLLVHKLLNRKWETQIYFDYGISTEHGGDFLNDNLLHHKEGFGMSTVSYETYQLVL